jgi:DNA-binding GntR family transcriptional regulator
MGRARECSDGTGMSDIAIITRRSLYDELALLLREMIINGELKPGDKIAEQALCLRFGVSRTPLREALKVLTAEGLVHLSPNRGASVASITAQEVDELFPIMGALEALAGEIACARITARDLARLRKLHATMIKHFNRKEISPYLMLNQAIHEAIFEITGNASLIQLYKTILARTHAVRFVVQRSPVRWQEATDDHERMMQALENRDGPALAAIMKEHLRNKAVMVHETLAEVQQRVDA